MAPSFYFARCRFPKIESRNEEIGEGACDTQVNVLIVDDDEQILHILESLLSRRGYQVAVAASTGQALEIAKSRPIDILVADVLLREGLTGIELAHELAKNHKMMEVLIISGCAGVNVRSHGIPETWQYLAKPFKSEKLLTVLDQLTTAHKLRRSMS